MSMESISSIPVEPTKGAPTPLVEPKKGAIKGRGVSKAKKPEKMVLPVPVELATGKTLAVIGKTIFHEKTMQTVSTLGYYGSRLTEGAGKLIEGAVDAVLREDTFGIVGDVLEVSTTERMTDAGTAQASQAKLARTAASFVPIVGGMAAKGIDIADAAGQASLEAAKTHVKVARSVYDTIGAAFIGILKAAIKTPVHYLVTRQAQWWAAQYKALGENPRAMREYLVESGDLMVGRAWKREQQPQKFLTRAASFADLGVKERQAEVTISEKEKVDPKLSLQDLKAMSKEQRESIFFLIHEADKERLNAKYKGKEISRGVQKAFKSSHTREENLLKSFNKNEKRTDLDGKLEELIKKYNDLSKREAAKLTPFQYTNLTKDEKLRLIDLVKEKQRLTPAESKQLTTYRQALVAGKLESEDIKAESLILRKFNSIPPEEQSAVLNMSSKEVGKLSKDERRALVEYIYEKVSKETGETAKQDLEKLEKLKSSKRRGKDEQSQLISGCFAKYLSQREKAAIRKMLHEKITTSEVTKEDLAKAREKLEKEVEGRIQKLEKAQIASEQDVLDTLELVQSLAYLKGMEAADLIERELEVEKTKTIERQKLHEQVGADVYTPGLVSKGFDLAGAVVEFGVTKSGWAASKLLRGIGTYAFDPKVVTLTMNQAANWVEHSQALIQMGAIASLIPGLGQGVQAITPYVESASEHTISAIIEAEKRAVGLFGKLAELEKGAWENYAQPMIDFLKQTARTSAAAERLGFFTNRLIGLKQKFVDNPGEFAERFNEQIKASVDEYGQYIKEYLEKNPTSKLKDLVKLDFAEVQQMVKAENPFLDINSEEYFQKVFSKLEESWVSLTQEIASTIPITGWIFKGPEVPLPDIGSFQLQPLLESRELITDQIAITERMVETAQKATQALGIIQETLAGKAASAVVAMPGGPTVEGLEAFEQFRDGARQILENHLDLAQKMQKGAEIHLEATRAQVQLFAGTAAATQEAISRGEKRAEELLATEESDESRLAQVKRAALSGTKLAAKLASLGTQFCSGQLAMRVMTKITARSLRRLAPLAAQNLQPFWYALARGTELGAKKIGAFEREVFSFAGRGIERGGVALYRAGVKAATGEASIDAARIEAFKKLSQEEKAHIRYVVLHSEKSLGVREKILEVLKGKEEGVRVSKPDYKTWERRRKEIEDLLQSQTLSSKDENRIISLILETYDQLETDDLMIMTPQAFTGKNSADQKKILRLISEHGHLTRAELEKPDPIVIAHKFNQLLKAEREELTQMSVQDFESLPDKDKNDLLYKIVFSKAYKNEFLTSVSERDLLAAQCKAYNELMDNGYNKDHLKKLLKVLSAVTESEGRILTAQTLKEMGPAKAKHLYTILADRGKLRGLKPEQLEILSYINKESNLKIVKKNQEKALVLLAQLYNGIDPAYKSHLLNFTLKEYLEKPLHERVLVIEHTLKNHPKLSDKERADLANEKVRLEKGIVSELHMSSLNHIVDMKNFSTWSKERQAETLEYIAQSRPGISPGDRENLRIDAANLRANKKNPLSEFVIQKFSEISVPRRADFREQENVAKKLNQDLLASTDKEIMAEKRAIRKLKVKLSEERDLTKIKKIENEIEVHKKNLEDYQAIKQDLLAGKGAAALLPKEKENPEITHRREDMAGQMFAPDVLARGDEGIIDASVELTLRQVLFTRNPVLIKEYNESSKVKLQALQEQVSTTVKERQPQIEFQIKTLKKLTGELDKAYAELTGKAKVEVEKTVEKRAEPESVPPVSVSDTAHKVEAIAEKTLAKPEEKVVEKPKFRFFSWLASGAKSFFAKVGRIFTKSYWFPPKQVPDLSSKQATLITPQDKKHTDVA